MLRFILIRFYYVAYDADPPPWTGPAKILPKRLATITYAYYLSLLFTHHQNGAVGMPDN